jgi:hypothetical protein
LSILTDSVEMTIVPPSGIESTALIPHSEQHCRASHIRQNSDFLIGFFILTDTPLGAECFNRDIT